MGAGSHENTLPTGGVAGVQECVCSHAHLRHGRAHTLALVLEVVPMRVHATQDSVELGGMKTH